MYVEVSIPTKKVRVFTGNSLIYEQCDEEGIVIGSGRHPFAASDRMVISRPGCFPKKNDRYIDLHKGTQ